MGFENVVRIYDTQTNKLIKELVGPGIDLRAVAFSPDGTHLATGGRNGQIRVWSLADAAVTADISAGGRRIRTLAYLADGEKIVSAGEGRTIGIWNSASGELLQQFRAHSAKVLSLTVCGPDLIATGGSDNVVRVWNWQSQTEVRPLSRAYRLGRVAGVRRVQRH